MYTTIQYLLVRLPSRRYSVNEQKLYKDLFEISPKNLQVFCITIVVLRYKMQLVQDKWTDVTQSPLIIQAPHVH